jgi:inorganic pyrophosphatase
MSKHFAWLSNLPIKDPETGDFNAVIETPKGSPNKYKFDPDSMAFRLGGLLPEGTSFPYDFGFIPSTRAADGDPLDILVLMDFPVFVGCLLTVRFIGVIEAKQKEKGGDWLRNDRLVGVASHAHEHAEVQAFADLRPHLLEEIEDFFGYYNKLRGKRFKVVGHGSPEKAAKIVKRLAKRGSY